MTMNMFKLIVLGCLITACTINGSVAPDNNSDELTTYTENDEIHTHTFKNSDSIYVELNTGDIKEIKNFKFSNKKDSYGVVEYIKFSGEKQLNHSTYTLDSRNEYISKEATVEDIMSDVLTGGI